MRPPTRARARPLPPASRSPQTARRISVGPVCHWESPCGTGGPVSPSCRLPEGGLSERITIPRRRVCVACATLRNRSHPLRTTKDRGVTWPRREEAATSLRADRRYLVTLSSTSATPAATLAPAMPSTLIGWRAKPFLEPTSRTLAPAPTAQAASAVTPP